MNVIIGSVGMSQYTGCLSPVYYVLRSRHTDDLPEYFEAVFKIKRFQHSLTRIGNGILAHRMRIPMELLKRELIPRPPFDEQQGIVRFIRNFEYKVNRFIRNRRRLIEVLNEQKQAIINRAVTRGLDPNARLKPSGIDWFPEVPVKWSVVPLRRVITRAVDGPHHSPNYVDDGVMFISARNIKVDKWALDDAKFISVEDYKEFCRRIKPEIGDVLYTKGGTTGVARAVDLDFPFQVWVHVAVLKLRRDIVSPDYLALVLNSTSCYQQSQLFTRGATNQDLGLGRMKGIYLSLPPSLEEQHGIVARVREGTRCILGAIESAESEINLIREYRTRLIADVVTGKVDVRGLAPAEPPVDDELLDEAFDDEEMLADDEAELVEEAADADG